MKSIIPFFALLLGSSFPANAAEEKVSRPNVLFIAV
ncbi:MAG: hypothetical protein RL693_2347, partial [Verrucomicrobiota bacterium]